MILTHVERVLAQHCEPGTHNFPANPIDHLRCRDCGRIQRRDGKTCLLCADDGEGQFCLANLQLGKVVDGTLCGSCQREFAFRGVIRGWVVTGYMPGEPISGGTASARPAGVPKSPR